MVVWKYLDGMGPKKGLRLIWEPKQDTSIGGNRMICIPMDVHCARGQDGEKHGNPSM